MSALPRISVVVALISGGTAELRRCLRALTSQTGIDPDGMHEILVPYDQPCAQVVSLGSEFPSVRFLPAPNLDSAAARAGASREHHDRLRAIGLGAASGDIVALTEDHAYAAPDWCRAVVDAMREFPDAGAIGGAVECDTHSTLNRAVWFCDFGRYQRPLPEGPSAFVSDSNVAYRRQALAKVADTWRDDYHETSVHWAMQEAGIDLRSSSRAVVWQARAPLSWGDACRERYVWGRSFAGTRATLIGGRRWVLAVASPLLPFVMTWRIARTSFARGQHAAEFTACAPAVFVLHAVWAVGECVGYVTGKPVGQRSARRL